MARYRVRFVFTGDPVDGDSLTITTSDGPWVFNFNTTGLGGNAVRIAPGILQETNYNLRESFRIEYNVPSGNIYDVGAGADVSDITGEFTSAPTISGTVANLAVSVVEMAPNLNILTATIDANVADTCDKSDVIVVSDVPFTSVTAPAGFEATFAATTSYRIVGLDRNRYYGIAILNDDGKTATKGIITPSYLNTGNIDVAVGNNDVIITNFLNGVEPMEYSLDGINYDTNNIFSNLTADDYTLYIRDAWGCETTTTFTIEATDDGEINIPDPYFFYSKANSLRMAKREEWDEAVIFKNSSNTLSCETVDDISYAEKHRFRSTDTIVIQFKTNYADIAVNTINFEDDSTENIPLTQVSANMGVKESLDCKLVSIGTNTFGVYFITGKRYNYDTGADLSDDYVLNGSLPQFAQVGGRITLSNVTYTITNVSLNEDLDVEQIEIESGFLTAGDSIVKSIYNIYDYEVFEASIPCLGKTEFSVQIYYGAILQRQSETIIVDDISTDLIHIAWSMEENTDFVYSTGIQPFARPRFDTIKAGLKNQGEAYETDTDSITISTDNYEVDVITFLPLTKEMARKVVLWLSSHNITIQGVSYRKDTIEMEDLERSNYYVVTATLVLRGTAIYEDRIGTSNVQIPQLIQTESDSFISGT